tara:strand:- start:4031 stop:4732 length:702 start_codon:yes stop_codon:yes gene_type:complete
MSSFLATVSEIPDGTTIFHHCPGSVFTYECRINGSPLVTAYCLVPYGTNKSRTTPLLIFFKVEGKFYSPLHIINKYVQDNGREKSLFTLISQEGRLKVVISKPIVKTEGLPLACIEEGSDKQPDTYIEEGQDYANFIEKISSGDLEGAMKIIKSNKEAVLKAYPHLKIIINNLEKVHDDLASLEYLKREREIPKEIQTFTDLSKYFKKEYASTEQIGILPQICKSFCYIPYQI